ncbi:hypothetical protein KIH87_18535 [Paraneptunicella aestuarii]|uniref:hypothetical protein n=1 Tax=Paraneptunicella aestuarii TaxID=2831148 RepID=UPI001E2F760B|nr:hypothetical protein [Paraneptunicella aestuarii]UAA38632.1 hypothetical protein KIH87_18535 [Paraneptunicella aestuarii]
MLLEYGFKKLSTYVTLAITAAILILSYGNPMVFDRAIVFVLIATALLSFKLDKNIFSIASIILYERIFEEVIWAIESNTFWYQELWYHQFYLLCIVLICSLNRQQILSKLVVLFVLIIEAAILHWIDIGYVIPTMYWPLVMIFETLVSIYLIRNRVFLWNKFIGHDVSIMPKSIDRKILVVMYLFIFLESLKLSEYMLRHVFGMHNILYLYNNYTYLSQALTACILWIMFIESWRLIKQSRFAA